MNKRIPLGISIALMALVAAVTFILTTSFSLELYNQKISSVREKAEIYKKLEEIDSYVRANYYGSVVEDSIIEAIAQGYMDVLDDKNAAYYSAEQYKYIKSLKSGAVVGVGIMPENDGGYIKVADLLPNGSAAAAGIQIGEAVVAVNGQDVLSIGYSEACRILNGAGTVTGASITLTVRNSGEDRTVSAVVRETTVATVQAKIIGSIGYIRILDFNDKTYSQFTSAIGMISSNNATGLVIDLRNVSGNNIETVIKILDNLLDAGDYAYSTDRNGVSSVIGSSDSSPSFKVPTAVIVNSRTNGASELFACAMRDSAGAKLVGSQTAGNSAVVTTYECLDGSAVSFTTAYISTPKTNYEDSGLKPDYEVNLTNDTKTDIDSLEELTDGQLKKALEVVSLTTE